ncbi:MAG: valine--tRNA ligase [Gemmatimonadetes bacterium]|nr:valine--tRNA ligase [Gemmatimonadota bacterium]
MAEGLPPQYDPGTVERKWYAFWEENQFFHADPVSDKPPYTIVIPPPNITGILHLGHVLNNTIQDILVRFKRMQGFETLWMPGTDHAGIATHVVVERMLAEQGIDREEIGRERFVEEVWKWREQYGGTIVRQLKELGCSCDWKRERFTMDEGLSRAVATVFIELFEKKMIYRGYRIINWCPRCNTALSNEEAVPLDERGSLWHIRYPLADGEGGISIATTRPETMLGDTAVAVHPDDERHAHLIGKRVRLPLTDRTIPIIADAELVDPEFGSGAVKVTPAHDFNDFMLGNKHDLPQIVIMDEDGVMNEAAGPAYRGSDRFDCRRRVVKDLEDLGLLERVDGHVHAVRHCQRCDSTLEPRLSRQWFLKTRPLAQRLLRALEEDGFPRFTPDHWEKTYCHWLEHIEDWCLSRQLWWGHRIPIWYCGSCESVHASVEAPDRCGRCGHEVLIQDEDVLDTWFSSALWPFSTMGWPERTAELEAFYPTSTLVTGHDILFFWVVRMMMMGYEFMDDRPFDDVYLTSLLRDIKGRKLSKSLGNSPDPLEVMDTYGTDALRYAMMLIAPHGQDVLYSNEQVEVGRNFANKMWNAARLVLMHQKRPETGTLCPENLWDRWILSRLARTVEQVTHSLTKYAFHEAALLLYDFFWHDYCDWYLEAIKQRVYDETDFDSGDQARRTALFVLERTLRLFHPFMPFITEEIWQQLRPYQPAEEAGPVSIVVAPWPETDPDRIEVGAERNVRLIQELIGAIRGVRADFRVHPTHEMTVYCQVGDTGLIDVFSRQAATVQSLARSALVFVDGDEARPAGCASGVLRDMEFYIPLSGLIDLEIETERLSRERTRVEQELEKVLKRLSNGQFLERAPAEVVEKEKKKQDSYEDMIGRLNRNLEMICAG